MGTDLIENIKKIYQKCSKSQKRIADYIFNNYDKAAFMTAAVLAQKADVSESTVVRFASKMGYDGYPKFQKALQELIRNKLTSLQRMEITSTKMAEKDVLKNVLTSDAERLRQTIEEIDENEFTGAVETILSAKTIYIMGTRSCSSVAGFLGFYFNLIFPNVKTVVTNSASETFEQIYPITKDDVMIAISYPRYSRRTINAVKYAADRKSKIIAVTDVLTSPITQNATYALLARSDMSFFVDSLVAPLSVINALIIAVVMRKKDEVTQIFENLENIWDEYEVYEKYNH